MNFREFQPVVRMVEDDDWNFVKTWKFTNCLKKKVHEGGGVGAGEGCADV